MHYRKLGTTEAEVSEIGFGAWGIGGKQWLGGQDDESIRALKRSFDMGVNFIDTALAYGDGHSEQLVGKVVKEAFHRIYVATKIPPKNRVWPASPSTPISDSPSSRRSSGPRNCGPSSRPTASSVSTSTGG